MDISNAYGAAVGSAFGASLFPYSSLYTFVTTCTGVASLSFLGSLYLPKDQSPKVIKTTIPFAAASLALSYHFSSSSNFCNSVIAEIGTTLQSFFAPAGEATLAMASALLPFTATLCIKYEPFLEIGLPISLIALPVITHIGLQQLRPWITSDTVMPECFPSAYWLYILPITYAVSELADKTQKQ